MSTGGVGSKRGNWYEEAALVPYLLRLLQESLSLVQWEHHGDGDGIDFSYVEENRIIGAQCKHRSDGRWIWGAITGNHPRALLRYAAEWLERGPAHHYRLTTDATFPELDACCTAARVVGDVDLWIATHAVAITRLSQEWAIDVKTSEGKAKLRDRCRRFAIELVGDLKAEEGLLAHAREVSDDPDLLIAVLLKQAKSNLGIPLTAAMVRTWLSDAECQIRPAPGDPRVGEILARRVDDFLQERRSTTSAI